MAQHTKQDNRGIERVHEYGIEELSVLADNFLDCPVVVVREKGKAAL